MTKCCVANVILLHPSPEHEDTEFYALAPKISGRRARVIEGRMWNAFSMLLAKDSCLEIHKLAR
jgi:hypothetical protein